MNDNKINSILKQVIIFNDIYEEVIHSSFKKNKHQDVSKLEFKMLQTVYRHQRLMISEISELLDISLPNCSRYVKTAINEGYLTKDIDALDKRIYYISLSEKGKAIVEQTLDRFSSDMSVQLADLDARELDRLDESFANLNSALSDTLLNRSN